MKEHPILFSGPMVRAILEGRKTQTRRVIKKHPLIEADFTDEFILSPGNHIVDDCPYGFAFDHDRLWVRETHYLFGSWEWDTFEHEWHFIYERDRGVLFAEPADVKKGRSNLTLVKGWYKRPSIFMPRWASRITLEITNVRAERLQAITEADCVEEGVQVPVTTEGCPPGKAHILTQLTGPGPRGTFAPCTYLPKGDESLTAYTRAHFANLWDSINAKRGYSWESNPFVWVIAFKKL